MALPRFEGQPLDKPIGTPLKKRVECLPGYIGTSRNCRMTAEPPLQENVASVRTHNESRQGSSVKHKAVVFGPWGVYSSGRSINQISLNTIL